MKIKLHPIKTIVLLLLTSITLTTSCVRQEGSAEVTVDTVETDFFDNMKSANAIKTYTGKLSCDSCEGVYTKLIINEDSLTFELAEKHANDTTTQDTLLHIGSFERNLVKNGSTRIELKDSLNTSFRIYEASGDTLLKSILNDEESGQGTQNTLRRQ